MLPRWGRGGGGTAFYKHSAPAGQERWCVAVLQTCCPAGAGEVAGPRSVNILPRWGRRVVRRSSTNMLPRWGRGGGATAFCKHSAPLGRRVVRRSSTNMLPRWGRGGGGTAFCKHAAPLGQGRWRDRVL